MAAKKSRGWRTPTKTHTPVIAGRVPEALHRQIKEAAKKSGRTMSDELAHRAAMSFQWEAALGEFEQAKKALADLHEQAKEMFAEATLDSTRHALEGLGWAKILDLRHMGHVWFEPGRHDFPKSGWLDPNKESPPVPPSRIIPEPEFMKAIADPKTREVVGSIVRELKSQLLTVLDATLSDPKK
jgi:hypothetical protein